MVPFRHPNRVVIRAHGDALRRVDPGDNVARHSFSSLKRIHAIAKDDWHILRIEDPSVIIQKFLDATKPRLGIPLPRMGCDLEAPHRFSHVMIGSHKQEFMSLSDIIFNCFLHAEVSARRD